MNSFSAGLVSITFRKLSPGQIVDLVARADLKDIEWGGDVHVPHGDITAAMRVRAITEEAGLRSVAYGSYYRVGAQDPASPTFETVLDTAFALGAPSIRVWAGNVDSAVATDEYVKRVAADASRIAELSARAGITVGFEYHGGTISDNADAALKLLERADHSNLYSLWQPSVGASPAERALSLSRLLPWLSHVHVFQWHIHERLPLSEGGSEWPAYVQILKERIQPTPMLIEFVAGEDPEQFLRDAQILKQWIDQAST